MAFTYPDQRLLQNAMQQNPIQAASAGLAQGQHNQAPGMNMPPSNQGFANQVAGNMANTGQTPGAKPADPASFNTGNFAYNSPQWYGKGNEYGTQMMANDPGSFWGGYSEDVMGMAPGSQTGSFLAGTYNPMAMGAAMFGKGFSSNDEVLAGSTSIANAIAGPGTTFFDPGSLISSTLQALASGNVEALAKQNPTLANIIYSSQGNPAGQVSGLTSFLKEALAGSMPQDVLAAFINQLSALGQVYISSIRKDPNISAMDQIGTFAKFLMNQLGPTLGL